MVALSLGRHGSLPLSLGRFPMKKLPLLFLATGLICLLLLIRSIGLTVGVALRLNQVVLILLGLATLAALTRRARKGGEEVQEFLLLRSSSYAAQWRRR